MKHSFQMFNAATTLLPQPPVVTLTATTRMSHRGHVKLTRLTVRDDHVVRIAAFEVGLDFDERILRFGLRHPRGGRRYDAVADYVEAWRKR